MVKLKGTGSSKHIAKGQVIETTDELAAIIIKKGAATKVGAKEESKAEATPAKEESKEAPKKSTKKK